MSKHDECLSDMLKATSKVSKASSDLAKDYPVITEYDGKLDDLIGRSDALRQELRLIDAGSSDVRRILKQSLEEVLMPFTLSLYSFAKKQGDVALMATTNLNAYKLARLRLGDLDQLALTVLNYAETHATELAHYGLTDAMVKDLRVRVTAYRDGVGGCRSNIGDRKKLRIELNAVYKEAKAFLSQDYDRFMETISLKLPSVYERYKTARTVLPRVRHYKKRVVAPATGNVNASTETQSANSGGNTQLPSQTTAGTGNFQPPPLPPATVSAPAPPINPAADTSH